MVPQRVLATAALLPPELELEVLRATFSVEDVIIDKDGGDTAAVDAVRVRLCDVKKVFDALPTGAVDVERSLAAVR